MLNVNRRHDGANPSPAYWRHQIFGVMAPGNHRRNGAGESGATAWLGLELQQVRQQRRSRPLLDSFEVWLRERLLTLSTQSET
ncbi:transposase fragment, IS66 family (plasmid) [Cupriavidus taiwanensis LMG 19424]|uniref:Transposase, IS66 family n=3 Tax=Cupriavidus TaxID=106589 RepID=B2AJF7_CUPTR|nr:transposase fragment, IS66 family [Cupriavidus taiwanensis LMG 19424]SPD37609.1 transposase [Cupriavidus taiwanensis]SPD61914.1 transposase [Cupriavidus taiwanensis]SPD62629.1 transposase [Cupriavidus neocaledonicus]SPD69695.1 transposase [Cupriavidus taiwanensis]